MNDEPGQPRSAPACAGTSNGNHAGNGLVPPPRAGRTDLPQATRERWQPLRCGLVDVFYYDHEEFWFRDGRLLLRGNNGTGKSKVLALTLPFLLDGEVAPHRVEPDGDQGKRMEWNLLLGGKYDERIGYVWLELGRLDGEATRTVTIGCGLKAVSGRGAPERWFFSTDQRIGRDVWLTSDARTPKTKQRLAEALAGRGRVLEQPSAWRRHVDELLFDLGTERYEALLRLLIQLRQPQLAKRPNEQALSAALTEALAPPDQAMLADVAEAFRSLEADRAELAGLEEAREAVQAFAVRYRRAAAVATRRQAGAVRGAQSAYEEVNRQRGAAGRELAEAEDAREAAAAEVAQLDSELGRARAEREALRDSPAMNDARALEREGEMASQARADAEAARARAEQAREAARSAADEADAAAAERDTARGDLDEALSLADQAAVGAGLADEHRAALQHASSDGADGDLDRARRAGEHAADRRDEGLRRMEALRREVDAAAGTLRDATQRRDDAASQAAAAAEQETAAGEQVAAAGEELRSAARSWAGQLVELPIVDADDLDAALATWTADLDGPDPLAAAVRQGYQRRADGLAAGEAEQAAEAREIADARAALDAERTALEDGVDVGPPTAPTRDADSRVGRAGAPLWRAVDFADHLDDRARAGLEAALDAAGLLDAWLTPDGALLDRQTHDAVVTAGPPAASSLGQALRPAVDRTDPAATGLPDEAVAGVLAGIGLGPAAAETWVADDGRYRVGVLEGRWRKDAAAHIGHAARAAARRRRLSAIATELDELDARLDALAAVGSELAERRRRLDAEAAGTPSSRPVVDAHSTLAGAARHRAELDARLAAAEESVALAAGAHERAVAHRADAAADLGLPVEPEPLQQIARAVGDYRVACSGLWPRLAAHHRLLAQAHRAADRDAQARRLAGQREREAAEAEQRAASSAQRVATLRARVGETVEALHRQLDEVARRLADRDERRTAADRRRGEHDRQAATLAERARQLDERAEETAAARRGATAAFQRFAATGLVATALPDAALPDAGGQPWAPDPTVRLARDVDRRLDDVDAGEDAWDRAQREVSERFRALADTLSRHGHHAELEVRADAPVVSIAFRQRQVRPDELATLLATEVADRGELLSARERELLEEHLVAEVAAHLADRITDAEAQVESINAALRARPTSTGMTLRLRWRTRRDAPTGLAEARRRLLRQTADAWSADDRRAVGTFLQDQIAAVRAAREAGTWLEHLTEALDYRAWHAFVIERRREGEWQPATGPASGGERALAVTVPMLAAAASFYDTAGNRRAPRPIMLDEAFAGVDDDARAKGFGLLAEFDLDLVATSEREWGCYPTVPGLAIAQLARRDGIDAVHVAKWDWDGHARRQVDIALPPLAEPGGAS